MFTVKDSPLSHFEPWQKKFQNKWQHWKLEWLGVKAGSEVLGLSLKMCPGFLVTHYHKIEVSARVRKYCVLATFVQSDTIQKQTHWEAYLCRPASLRGCGNCQWFLNVANQRLVNICPSKTNFTNTPSEPAVLIQQITSQYEKGDVHKQLMFVEVWFITGIYSYQAILQASLYLYLASELTYIGVSVCVMFLTG